MTGCRPRLLRLVSPPTRAKLARGADSGWRFYGLTWDQAQSLGLAVVIIGLIVIPQWCFSLVRVPPGYEPPRRRPPQLFGLGRGAGGGGHSHTHAHRHAHGDSVGAAAPAGIRPPAAAPASPKDE